MLNKNENPQNVGLILEALSRASGGLVLGDFYRLEKKIFFHAHLRLEEDRLRGVYGASAIRRPTGQGGTIDYDLASPAPASHAGAIGTVNLGEVLSILIDEMPQQVVLPASSLVLSLLDLTANEVNDRIVFLEGQVLLVVDNAPVYSGIFRFLDKEEGATRAA